MLTTVTVSIAVACSVSVAVFRTGGWSDPETGDGHAPLVDAEGSVVAFGTFRGQPRVDLVQTQVDQGCPAGDDPTLVVDERVRENGDRLHAELKLLVQVGTVEHATPVVRRKSDIHSISSISYTMYPVEHYINIELKYFEKTKVDQYSR